ncbi:unnamed protein product [Psylliodes chrysocephalus]|uniref:Serine/threonine-protein phosphatase 4 regulatory subunit 2 n=1 Tax=Psylliodes chrysocephalus TaxID=3402493 RepID=A0A9P0CQW2_9CUCU|nr:unnamed protein product [Psylliodes chrysocephala]
MENPEEILHSLEEFSKMKPKDIPRELEEYLCFVAKTGNPIYQWSIIKSLFREKLINVITEFYESCPSMDIPPCPNVEMFNYDMMKNFILEKLDTFAAAPFTVQRICELLTTPRKEYNRIDKYMRALEKNILVVSTTEPGRRSTENGEGIMNGIESEHLPESSNSSHDINIEDMDESPSNWSRHEQATPVLYKNVENEDLSKNEVEPTTETSSTPFVNDQETKPEITSSSDNEEPKPQPQETVITCTSTEETIETYVSVDSQETTYQNLSEESSSNSSDSSASASESKEAIPEEKEPTEQVPKVEDTIVPKEDQHDIIKEETVVSENKPDPLIPPSEETTFESTSPESKQDTPEIPIEEISSENSSESLNSTEITSISETSSEAEEKSEEKEAEHKEAVQEKETIDEIKSASEDRESENVVDSSTDILKEVDGVDLIEEKSEVLENQSDEAEVKDIVTSDTVDVKDKEDETPTPMDIDVKENNPEKKVETEEPSSSVETFVKLMSEYYPRD